MGWGRTLSTHCANIREGSFFRAWCRDKAASLAGGEHMRGSSEKAYRAGVAVALATAFLTVWTTVVRDDGNGIGFFLLIMAAMVGGFSAWFRPAGLARTML